jgi:hypothetical protein
VVRKELPGECQGVVSLKYPSVGQRSSFLAVIFVQAGMRLSLWNKGVRLWVPSEVFSLFSKDGTNISTRHRRVCRMVGWLVLLIGGLARPGQQIPEGKA